jgi:CxxC motif-containing protein
MEGINLECKMLVIIQSTIVFREWFHLLFQKGVDSVREILCIVCPNGCRLLVGENGESITVSGNLCKRGVTFAEAEITHPMRTLTTTVRTAFSDTPVLPVRTDREIPKGSIPDVMQFLNCVVVTKRLKIGDIVAENVLELKSNIIATSDVLIG